MRAPVLKWAVLMGCAYYAWPEPAGRPCPLSSRARADLPLDVKQHLSSKPLLSFLSTYPLFSSAHIAEQLLAQQPAPKQAAPDTPASAKKGGSAEKQHAPAAGRSASGRSNSGLPTRTGSGLMARTGSRTHRMEGADASKLDASIQADLHPWEALQKALGDAQAAAATSKTAGDHGTGPGSSTAATATTCTAPNGTVDTVPNGTTAGNTASGGTTTNGTAGATAAPPKVLFACFQDAWVPIVHGVASQLARHLPLQVYCSSVRGSFSSHAATPVAISSGLAIDYDVSMVMTCHIYP